jgi:parallel beta helix pectate lyase-like protein
MRARRMVVVVGVVLTAALGIGMVLGVGTGTATEPCTKVAAPNGSDTNSGTIESPYRTVQKLSDSLAAGNTGCLRAGTYTGNVSVTHGGTAEAGVTIRNYPNEKATVVGRLWIERAAPYITFTGLYLDGVDQGRSCEPNPCPSPTINAEHVTFTKNDVTNEHTWICFVLGDSNGVFGRADYARIVGNRIHDCGAIPRTNKEHGIYAQATRGFIITDNYIYNNADKGILFYPEALEGDIERNVIEGNGSGILFSAHGTQTSSNNRVERNVIADSRAAWNVASFYAREDTVGTGNVVSHNCLYASNENTFYNSGGGDQGSVEGYLGYSVSENTIARSGVGFVNAELGDYRLRGSSECLSLFTSTEAVSLSAETPSPLP